ncbi:MAG: hypothetical protein E6J20_14695 [Chloroflexi bacterium]|nr:MAG: hypothetical protein E6J20_14695 [Chloroflexota bacterium]
MRSHFAGGGIVLLLLAACGSQPSASPVAATIQCTNTGAPHHAYVVVQHMSGAWMERCVGFAASFIDGQTVMDQSGIEYQAEPVGSGKVVCQVDQEPAQFSQCFPQNRPYWALFIASRSSWSSAGGGYTDVTLHDGEALGWRYVNAADPKPLPPPMPRRLES